MLLVYLTLMCTSVNFTQNNLTASDVGLVASIGSGSLANYFNQNMQEVIQDYLLNYTIFDMQTNVSTYTISFTNVTF